MKINYRTWIVFFVLTILSFFIWFKLSYPQLAFVDFSINRSEALTIARDYIRKEDPTIDQFKSAIVFTLEKQSNQYLQKTLGFTGLKEFVKDNDFDMFFWLIRFFKESQKEEYRLTVSSATGEVTSLSHTIDETASRPTISQEEAKEKAKTFLQNKFHIDFEKYAISTDAKNSLDNRVDYSFTWRKNGIEIPWSKEKNSGIGKLVTGVTVSGNDILSFAKNTFIVPDQFNRDLGIRRNTGQNLSTLMRIIYTILFAGAVFFVVVRRNHLAMHNTKKFYLGIATIAFLLSIASEFNQFQVILFDYPTTSSFIDYLGRHFVHVTIDALLYSIALLMPSLSGELLQFEIFKNTRGGSFLHYIQSTFLSRSVTQLIFIGYFACVILLAMQSILIKFGQNYLGVWVEYDWMTHLSTGYLPFLTAFTIGYMASFYEETMYRLFAISWGKKIFGSIFVAVLLSSLIWGFAHSSYPVYPMWFRGIEVACLGIFLSFIYLRFGIIPVIVTHYLFDAFWTNASYLLGNTKPFYFYSSLMVLLLPLIFGIVAWMVNRKEEIKPLRWHLNKHQLYNLEILKSYLKLHPDQFQGKEKEQIKKEISSHGWDVAVVDIALEDMDKE